MSYEAFKAYTPQKRAKAIISIARTIIAEYLRQGLQLTLRQLYYQFVARDIIPNTEKSYSNLGNVISRARLGGLVDWDAIEDRVRRPVIWQQFDSVRDMLEDALQTYRLPRLDGQPTYVELWVEKDALAGVLRPIASQYHVTLMVNRGYSSQSAMKEAGDRIRECCETYQCERAKVFYLGDLDPSGEDMVRDIRERLEMFINEGLLVEYGGDKTQVEDEDEATERKPLIDFEVEKLALTMDQVEEHKPPPNPAKLSDSRAKAFIAKYGKNSWEVDALPPNVLASLITEALEEALDMHLIDQIKDREAEHKAALRDALAEMDV